MNFGNFLKYNNGDSISGDLNIDNSKKSILALSNQKNTLTQDPENKLKSGVTSEDVKQLQTNLKKLGFFTGDITGFYGDVTASAVQNFQKSHSLAVTGEANKETLDKLNDFVSRPIYVASRGSDARDNSQKAAPAATQTVAKTNPVPVSVQPAAKGGVTMMPWFGGVENVYSIGSIATVTDLNTGLAFKIKRTYGYNHADNETLTAADTAIMKRAAGGSWNWTRRPVIVEVNGYKIAASLAPFPHAGRDDMPANVTVSNRSGDYGTGENLDSVKGNNMDGHFDIHFLGSKTHGSNSIDADHQAAVKRAFELGSK